MKGSTATLVLLYALFVQPALQAATPIGEALKKSLVSVRAKSASGHSTVEMTVRNLTQEPLTVDVLGAMLIPRRHGVQRLGVPRIAQDNGTTYATLEPGKTATYVMPSFCLDQPRNSPTSGTFFTLAPNPVRRQTKRIFRFWNSNRHLSQSDVQSAVWSGGLEKLKKIANKTPTGILPPFNPPNEKLMIAEGITFWLGGDGQLRVVQDPANRDRDKIVARGISGIVKTDKGLVAASIRGDKKYNLRYYDGTNWRDLGVLPFLPTQAGRLPDKSLAFLNDRFFSANNRSVRTFSAPVRKAVFGRNGDLPFAVVIDRTGKVRHLGVGSRTESAPFAVYKDAVATDRLTAYLAGREISWHVDGQPNRKVRMGQDVKQLAAAGDVLVAVTTDRSCWRVDANGPHRYGKLPQRAVSWALDPDYEVIRVLMPEGRMASVPVNGTPK